MKCSRCGRELPDGALFCNYCGCKVTGMPEGRNIRTQKGKLDAVANVGVRASETLKKGRIDRKYVIGIAALVCLVVLSCVFLFRGDKLSGTTWKGDGVTISFDHGNWVSSGYERSTSGTYEISGNQLTINEGGQSTVFTYKIVGNAMTWTYISEEGEERVGTYMKQ